MQSILIQNREDECSDGEYTYNNNNGDIEENENRTKNGEFICKKCNYLTKNRYDYNKHLSTKKHTLQKECCSAVTTQCKTCNRFYSSVSNLWKHSKKCKLNDYMTDSMSQIIDLSSNIDGNDITPTQITTDMLLEFMKQNKELQSFMAEQQKELQNTIIELSKNKTIINNTSNTNNNFNLNFFLNEKCKNAINITDFVDSMQLSVNDIEATGRLGYIMGISRIFLNKLRELDVYNRPLHCTDIKREIVYIKEQNVWGKEEQSKPKLKQIIKKIARKNLLQITNWQLENPDYEILDTPENEAFINLSLCSLGSANPDDEEKDYNKILKNVFKEVILDKDPK